jgi:RNA polymerase sigma-70 factor (ECF subfamily)
MRLQAQHEIEVAQSALKYYEALYRYAMTLTRSQADSEDLVQETYARALNSLHQLGPGGNMRAWLYAILRNQWLNGVRHEASGPSIREFSEGEVDVISAETTAGTDPYAGFVCRAQAEDVRTAVDALPPIFREVITLREFEGLDYEEIGKITGVNQKTVATRLLRARDRLRAALSQWQEKPPGAGFHRREEGQRDSL